MRKRLGIGAVGWAWLVAGFVLLLRGVCGLVFPQPEPMRTLLDTGVVPVGASRLAIALQKLHLFRVLQILVGGVSVIAAINLLRLRAWARTTLLVLSSLMLVYVVTDAVFWAAGWLRMCVDVDLRMPLSFTVITMVMGLAIPIVLTVALIAAIKLLGSDTVKDMVGAS